jgi:hypothetical protein
MLDWRIIEAMQDDLSKPRGNSMLASWRTCSIQSYCFLVLILLVMASAVSAASESAQVPHELKAKLENTMNDLKMTPSLGSDNPVCRAFADDFRRQTDIQYVSPIVRAESYDDSALTPYKKKCPRLQLNKLITVPARDQARHQQSEEELEAYGNVYLGLHNFQLFKVDINNNPADGEEYVFYYEGERNKKTNQINSGRAYRVINFSQCRIDDGIYFNRGASNQWSLNEIIDYKGKNAIFLLTSSSGPKPLYYLLSLQLYQPSLQRIATLCNYRLSR